MRTLLVNFCLGLGVALSFATPSLAQMPAYTQAGPIPSALATARTIFISNAGADSGLFYEPFPDDPNRPYIFSGDPDRAYTEFYAALKATGKFNLVSNPEIADLVLELRLTAPENPVMSEGEVYPLPVFRLVIYDGKTHYILWTVTHSIDNAILRRNCDKNFDAALAEVLNHFLQTTGKSTAPAH